MNLAEQSIQSFIINVLKNEPPIKGDNAQSLNDWFTAIKGLTHCDVSQFPPLALKLMYIWESQAKGIIITNLELDKK